MGDKGGVGVKNCQNGGDVICGWSLTEKFRSENSSLWGFTFGWTFFMSHPAEDRFPVSTFPYLNTIRKTNS